MLRKITICLIFFMVNQAFAAPGIDMGVLIEQLTTLKKQINELRTIQRNLNQINSVSGEQVNTLKQIWDLSSDSLNLSQKKSTALKNVIFDQLKLMPNDNPDKEKFTQKLYKTLHPAEIEQIHRALAKYQHQPDPPEVVAQKAKALGIESEELTKQAASRYYAYSQKVDLQHKANLETTEAGIRLEKINKFEQNIENLGDNSDLATLQLISRENVALMVQNEKIIELLTELLASQDNFMSNQASQEAKWQQEEFDRLERLRNTQVSEQVKKELRRTKWERI